MMRSIYLSVHLSLQRVSLLGRLIRYALLIVTATSHLGCSALFELQTGYVHQIAASEPVHRSPQHRATLTGHAGLGNRRGHGFGVSSQLQIASQGLGGSLGIHGFHLWEDDDQIAYFLREALYSSIISPRLETADAILLPFDPELKVTLNPGVIYYPSQRSADFYSLSLELSVPLGESSYAFTGYTVSFLLGMGMGGVR